MTLIASLSSTYFVWSLRLACTLSWQQEVWCYLWFSSCFWAIKQTWNAVILFHNFSYWLIRCFVKSLNYTFVRVTITVKLYIHVYIYTEFLFFSIKLTWDYWCYKNDDLNLNWRIETKRSSAALMWALFLCTYLFPRLAPWRVRCWVPQWVWFIVRGLCNRGFTCRVCVLSLLKKNYFKVVCEGLNVFVKAGTWGVCLHYLLTETWTGNIIFI